MFEPTCSLHQVCIPGPFVISAVLTPFRYHGDGSRPFPSSSDTTVLGLCTGSLTAAAISTSANVFELLPAAVEAVLIAFRIGLRSIEVRDEIERGSQGASPVWSVIVGMQENQALQELDRFSAAKVYISVTSKIKGSTNASRAIPEVRGHT